MHMIWHAFRVKKRADLSDSESKGIVSRDGLLVRKLACHARALASKPGLGKFNKVYHVLFDDFETIFYKSTRPRWLEKRTAAPCSIAFRLCWGQGIL